MSQEQRDVVMKKFREKKIQVLIATDVAARGIDVDDVTHVLHCDLPDDVENYTHRSGRTARAGKSGVSIIIGSSLRKIKFIEQQLGITVKPVQVPTGDQLCQKQLEHFSQKLIETTPNETIKSYLPTIQTALDALSKEEIIEKLVTLNCGEMLQHYKQASNLNATARDSYSSTSSSGRAGWDNNSRDGRSDRGRRSNADYVPQQGRFNNSSRDEARLFINVGKIDSMTKESLIKFIATTSAVDGSCVSRISMQNTRSFFTVEDSKKAQAIVKSLKESTLRGRRIHVEYEPTR